MKEQDCSEQARRSPGSGLTLSPRPVEPVLSWRLFPRTQCLRRWVEQLNTPLQSRADRRLAGDTVFIEHMSPRTVEALGQLIAAELGMGFIAINPDHDESLHTAARARQFGGNVVFLQPGRWQIADETCGTPDEGTPQGRVRRLLERHAIARRFIVVSTAGSFAGLAAPLQRTDAFNRLFAVPLPNHEELGQLLIDLCGDEMLSERVCRNPGRLGRLAARRYAGHEQRLRLRLTVQQRVAQERRKLDWSDLVLLTVHGFAESDPQPEPLPATRERVAWHEAGHALVAMVDSGGTNIPELITVLPSAACLGLVMSSLEHAHAIDEVCTREMLDHEVRVLVAGRAAEEIVYGSGGVSDLCVGDLEDAAERVRRGFTVWGYGLADPSARDPGLTHSSVSQSNGAFAAVRDDPTLMAFLEERYRTALELIRANRALLAGIHDQLLVRNTLFRDELDPLCATILDQAADSGIAGNALTRASHGRRTNDHSRLPSGACCEIQSDVGRGDVGPQSPLRVVTQNSNDT